MLYQKLIAQVPATGDINWENIRNEIWQPFYITVKELKILSTALARTERT